jgi:hypothetical protein
MLKNLLNSQARLSISMRSETAVAETRLEQWSYRVEHGPLHDPIFDYPHRLRKGVFVAFKNARRNRIITAFAQSSGQVLQIKLEMTLIISDRQLIECGFFHSDLSVSQIQVCRITDLTVDVRIHDNFSFMTVPSLFQSNSIGIKQRADFDFRRISFAASPAICFALQDHLAASAAFLSITGVSRFGHYASAYNEILNSAAAISDQNGSERCDVISECQ